MAAVCPGFPIASSIGFGTDLGAAPQLASKRSDGPLALGGVRSNMLIHACRHEQIITTEISHRKFHRTTHGKLPYRTTHRTKAESVYGNHFLGCFHLPFNFRMYKFDIFRDSDMNYASRNLDRIFSNSNHYQRHLKLNNPIWTQTALVMLYSHMLFVLSSTVPRSPHDGCNPFQKGQEHLEEAGRESETAGWPLARFGKVNSSDKSTKIDS